MKRFPHTAGSKWMTDFPIGVLFVALAVHSAYAEIPPYFRTWTSNTGNSNEATLVHIDSTNVLLRTRDGRETKVACAALCRWDQQFVKDVAELTRPDVVLPEAMRALDVNTTLCRNALQRAHRLYLARVAAIEAARTGELTTAKSEIAQLQKSISDKKKKREQSQKEAERSQRETNKRSKEFARQNGMGEYFELTGKPTVLFEDGLEDDEAALKAAQKKLAQSQANNSSLAEKETEKKRATALESTLVAVYTRHRGVITQGQALTGEVMAAEYEASMPKNDE